MTKKNQVQYECPHCKKTITASIDSWRITCPRCKANTNRPKWQPYYFKSYEARIIDEKEATL